MVAAVGIDEDQKMNGKPRASIVIRAYNEEAHIEKLLLGIAAQRLPPHEVILVDSGSTDDTVAIARRHGARIVAISPHDFTFGRALNLGCEAATGDILVFVSAHVYPTHDVWLERLVEPFSDERVVLSYGKQRGDTVNKYSEHQIFAKWFPNEPARPQQSYFCNNANCAVRRSVWEKLPYDETLTGLEDLDWAKRAQAQGGWLVYVPEAKIVHVHDETWPQVQNRYRREALALRRIDEHAKFTAFDFMRLFAANVVADCRMARRDGVLSAELSSILRFRFHQLYGTWQGHSGPSDLSAALRHRFYYPAGRRERHAEKDVHERHRIDYEQLTGEPGVSPPPLVVVADNTPARKSAGKRPAR